MLSDVEEELRDEVASLRALLHRERRARYYRSEVQTLLGETTDKVDPFGVANVIARGFADIVQAGWVCVGFLQAEDPNMVDFVFGASMPDEVAADWRSAPLDTEVPMAEVLRGDAPSIELGDDSGFGRWPLFAAEAERAAMGSFACFPIPSSQGRLPTAVIGLAWPEAHHVDDDERILLDDIIGASAPAFERARRSAVDRQVAHTLQKWLLPPSIPEHECLDVATLYLPGRDEMSVGGDWYDLVQLDDVTSTFVIGDVVGHNARAAAEMGQVRHVLASSLLGAGGDPASALQRTDEYFTKRSSDTMATAMVMVVSLDHGTVTIASAGHLPPVVTDPGTASRLIETEVGPPIGAGLGGYENVIRALPVGALLAAFTDGVVERRGEVIDDSLLALCRSVDRAVERATSHATADASAVIAELEARVHESGSADDAAAIVLRRR